MLEILQFYVSSFWVWAGITYGAVLAGSFVCALLRAVIWGRE